MELPGKVMGRVRFQAAVSALHSGFLVLFARPATDILPPGKRIEDFPLEQLTYPREKDR